MLDKIKGFFFNKAVSRAVENLVKFIIAKLTAPVVIASLAKYGVSIDTSKFGPAITGAILFAIAYVYHLYVQHKQAKGEVPVSIPIPPPIVQAAPVVVVPTPVEK